MLIYDSLSQKIRTVDSWVPLGENETAWIHVTGEQPKTLLPFLKNWVHPHPLVIENFSERNYRPKIHLFKDHAFMTFLGIRNLYDLVEFSILVGKNFVITALREPLPFIENVRRNFQDQPENMRHTGHILYHLLDELGENHLYSVDRIVEEIQKVEREVFDNPFSNDIGHQIFEWRNQIHELRRCVEEELEVIRRLRSSELPYVDEESGFYFQDLEDDFNRVLNAFDAFKEQMRGVIDLQTSLKADHMNSIMKTLTLVSVVFIPITFLAGIYGMNFEYMPELKWRYGYLGLWLIVLTIALSIITYFRKRRWW
ncbi:magnesium transporter CorA family protein [Effusibacillus consociatus]|uniref:Magnesium transporter CorA family protein n=1 Tax=Effusibacillus consociatus TaxID=1117041 RepID=A0ABV9Q197_9BACL